MINSDEWKEHMENAWFRSDVTYAGKDHTKNNKTFICISNRDEEKTGFKTLEKAIEWVEINLMTIKHKSPKQVTIRQRRIEGMTDPASCRTMISIWHRKDYLVEHEKEILESIVDEKGADYEPVSN